MSDKAIEHVSDIAFVTAPYRAVETEHPDAGGGNRIRASGRSADVETDSNPPNILVVRNL